MGQSQQDATKFEVKIRVQEKEPFRPGMSVTAEIETRYRTNVLAVPIQSVTTRVPKKDGPAVDSSGVNLARAATDAPKNSDMETRNAPFAWLVTVSFVYREFPRSPCSAFPTHRPYCCHNGSSSPSSSRTVSN